MMGNPEVASKGTGHDHRSCIVWLLPTNATPLDLGPLEVCCAEQHLAATIVDPTRLIAILLGQDTATVDTID
jgi:hypothetical protein